MGTGGKRESGREVSESKNEEKKEERGGMRRRMWEEKGWVYLRKTAEG